MYEIHVYICIHLSPFYIIIQFFSFFSYTVICMKNNLTLIRKLDNRNFCISFRKRTSLEKFKRIHLTYNFIS